MGTLSTSKVAQFDRDRLKCLYIQIGDLNQIYQSLMALRAVVQLYPEMDITLLVREEYEVEVKKVPWIADVIVLPVEKILEPLFDKALDDSNAMKIAAKWLAPIVKANWDYVVNWSYTEASSFLAGLIPSKCKLGFSRGKDAELFCADDWSQYVQGVLQQSASQNIHLIDIYTTQLLTALQVNHGEPKDVGNEPVTSKNFFKVDLETNETFDWNWKFTSRKWLALHLDSKIGDEVIGLKKWKNFIRYVLRRHPDYNIVILGKLQRETDASEFLQFILENGLDAKRFLNLTGEIDFDLKVSVLSQCQWIVSARSPDIALASVLGTRVIYLDQREAQVERWGPYGNGHYMALFEDTQELSSETVYGIWSYASSEWTHQRKKSIRSHFSQLGWSDFLLEARFYRSRIRLGDEGGGVTYESLAEEQMTLAQWTSLVMGQVARSWYCGWTAPVGQEIHRDKVHSGLLKDLRELKESVTVLEKICQKAELVSRQLELKALQLKSDRVMKLSDKHEIEIVGKKLSEIDSLIERTGRVHPALSVFADMIQVMMHNAKGESLLEISQSSHKSYRKLTQGVGLMRQWLQHSLDLVRPQAVKLDRPQLNASSGSLSVPS